MVKDNSNKVPNGIHKYLRLNEEEGMTIYRAQLFFSTYSLIENFKRDAYLEKKEEIATFDIKRKLSGSLSLPDAKKRTVCKKELSTITEELTLINDALTEVTDYLFSITPEYEN